MTMHFNEYQQQAWSYALPSAMDSKNYLLPGLTGEIGELNSYFAKAHRDGYYAEHETIKKELGDILWFVAGLATAYDLSLLEIAEANIKKLDSRRRRGTIQGSGDNR